MKFIGITGGVGTGKSEVMRLLAAREDTKVLLADEVAHLLYEKGQRAYNEILKAYPTADLLAEDGSFDRQKLAAFLFSDQAVRTRINAIVHPAVKEYVLQAVEAAREEKSIAFFFFEAALLIEDNYGAICDELWYIYSNEEIRRERLKASRGYSDQKIDEIFSSQLSEEEFMASCQEKICNNGSIESLETQLSEVLRRKIHE